MSDLFKMKIDGVVVSNYQSYKFLSSHAQMTVISLISSNTVNQEDDILVYPPRLGNDDIPNIHNIPEEDNEDENYDDMPDLEAIYSDQYYKDVSE